MSDEYEAFADQTYALQPPTNAAIQELMRLQLRSPLGGTIDQKIQTAELMGWDPTDVIPGHERTEEVDGEVVTRGNDLEELTLPEYFAAAAEVVLIGCDTEGREDALRVDEVRRATDDFTEQGLGMSGASGI